MPHVARGLLPSAELDMLLIIIILRLTWLNLHGLGAQIVS